MKNFNVENKKASFKENKNYLITTLDGFYALSISIWICLCIRTIELIIKKNTVRNEQKRLFPVYYMGSYNHDFYFISKNAFPWCICWTNMTLNLKRKKERIFKRQEKETWNILQGYLGFVLWILGLPPFNFLLMLK